MSLIEVDNVSKDYIIYKNQNGVLNNIKGMFKRDKKVFKAIKDINFNVEKGEAVAYIGPNGAGKSTTIKILSGILQPTCGSVKICDIEPYNKRRQHAKNIGVIFGQRSQLWWDIPAIDSLNLLSYMYKIDRDTYNKRIKDFDDFLEFGDFINKPVRQLSLGERMRIDFAAALIHSPDILLLDEPTIGMDVVAKDRVREFVKWINAEKHVTVLLTSHDMQDIQEICNRVIMIDKGTIHYDGTMELFCKKHQKKRFINIELQNLKEANIVKEKFDVIKENDNIITIVIDNTCSVKEVLFAINDLVDIKDISVQNESIEEIVRNVFVENSNS